MKPFDVCGDLPTGTTLLQASAGTGKTFTIAALTTRYVAEGVATLPEIMLVTFGRAATRELRDRVRKRLVSAERGLRDPVAARASGDEVLTLLAAAPDEVVAVRRQRLTQALADVDAAMIATTHSFCIQMLAGLGVAADTDRAAVFTENIDDLVGEVVDDLYVRTFARPLAGGASAPFVSRAQALELGRRAVGSDRAAVLWPLDGDGTVSRRVGLARAVRSGVEKRKRRAGVVDWDDALTLLRDALQDPQHGAVACGRVRSRYRVVLVDEFQDTDAVQWGVLSAAFHGHATLVLIGDPKQAVYGFRGADVTAYLAASRAAGTQATLGTNRRSDHDLVTALGLLFGNAALGETGIDVDDVLDAHPGRRLVGAWAPLQLRRVPRPGSRNPPVDLMREACAADVAAGVVDLLSGGATFEGRPVRPEDVAVLVRSNKQGQLVRDELAKRRVPVVLTGGGSVFGTASARAWLVLLQAMDQPNRAGKVRLAALSVFVGTTEATLDADGDTVTDALGPRLVEWARLFVSSGLAAFFEVLCSEEELPGRVLALPDGERQLTDLRHVAQALHEAVVAESLGLPALVEWLKHRITRVAAEDLEERTRRLESDAAAVKVMTVHASKGLEFPVVYVPFGWDRFPFEGVEVLRLHDVAGERVLDVGGERSERQHPAFAETRRIAGEEESGEDLRLLYVALTRAKSQVVAHWAPTGKNTATSPLHRILFGHDGPRRVPRARVEPPDDGVAAAVLQRLADRSGGTISAAEVVPRPVVELVLDAPGAGPLGVSRFDRALDTAWRRTSYSALTADAHAAFGVTSEADAVVKDDEQDGGLLSAAPAGSPPSPLTGLPGGRTFGTLVHEVLEETDPAGLSGRCRDVVARRGSSVVAADLAAGLDPVLRTTLGSVGRTLADFGARDRLAELDFEMPLAGGDTTTGAAATLHDVAALLGRHDLGDLAAYPALLLSLEPTALKGFLTGSIDAVLRLPSGAYAVVDYKTNRLGPDPLTAWHYRAEAMTEEMLHSHYVLQALLYSVALHRYLRWRQPGYDPAAHLGPVLYLFVRGMCGPDSPPGAGVFEWQVPPALVTELSDLLAGRGAAET